MVKRLGRLTHDQEALGSTRSRVSGGAENASTVKCKYGKCEYVPANIFVEITVKLLSLSQTKLKQLNRICIFYD